MKSNRYIIALKPWNPIDRFYRREKSNKNYANSHYYMYARDIVCILTHREFISQKFNEVDTQPPLAVEQGGKFAAPASEGRRPGGPWPVDAASSRVLERIGVSQLPTRVRGGGARYRSFGSFLRAECWEGFSGFYVPGLIFIGHDEHQEHVVSRQISFRRFLPPFSSRSLSFSVSVISDRVSRPRNKRISVSLLMFFFFTLIFFSRDFFLLLFF